MDYYKEYELVVFNAWGQIIYRSGDPADQWDGSHHGEACDDGIYAFVIHVKGLTGKYYRYWGTVQLMR